MEKDNLHNDNGGFKVPEGYFKNLSNHLADKISDQNTSSPLPIPKKDPGFKVPETYFTSFEEKILQKVEPQQPKGKLISLAFKRNIIYLSGIAAMIALILSLPMNKKTELDFNSIQITDIHTYFSEEDIELTNAEMATLLEDELDYTQDLEDELINEDTVLDYLSEENLDDDLIFVE